MATRRQPATTISSELGRELLANWRWLIGERALSAFAAIQFGDLFVEDDRGEILVLDVISASFAPVARSRTNSIGSSDPANERSGHGATGDLVLVSGSTKEIREGMKLEKVAAIAEVVSSVAVLVTLIYLSVQTRQNTEALLAVSRQATLQGEMTALSTLVTYPIDFTSADDPDWSADQELRFEGFLVQTLRVREFAWFQYRGGTLDEDTWQSYLRPLAGIFASARSRRYLDKYYGDPNFKAYLANWLSSSQKQ